MIMMKRLLVSRLLLLVTTVAVVNGTTRKTTTKCTLSCSNHGRCIVGNESFVEIDPNLDVPFFHQANTQGQYCLCNKGWTGADCDTIYESCGVKGGECLNGGDCVEGLIDDYGNPQFLCDCSNATDINGTLYAGKYCEHPSSKYCDNNNPDLFCVNGNDCDSSYPLSALPCKCVDGYVGFHCEFTKDQVPNCTLDCLNEGVCVVGILSPDQADGRYNFQGDDDQQFQRCECPGNFEGLYCEIEKEPCGEEFCYFGGTCKADNKTCDCSTSKDKAYRGQYCQFRTNEDFVGDSENTTQQVPCGRNAYCFNGGVCSISMVDGEIDHHCDCSTADQGGLSYVGEYCQYLSTDCGDNCQNETSTKKCGDQFCFNGATCQTSQLNNQHHCSCAKGYAGTYCEYKATNCSLDCQNGGICVQGGLTDADADDTYNFWNASVSYDHCLCADGFDGEQCELKQEVCDNGQKCYNGGTCVKTTISGQSRYHCDCSPAITDTTAFAGRFCEYKASEICSRDANNNALLFCVNEGVCIGDGYEGCACSSNFTGFSCEFVKAIPAVTSVGGGATTTTSGGSSAGQGTTTTTGGSSAGQGTTTTTTNDGSGTGQGTTTTTTSSSSNTKSNPLIDLCTTGNVPPGQPRYFCINGGSCKAYVPGGQPHPGCNCVSGWEGPQCEMRSNNNDSPKKALVAIKVLLALVTIVLFGMVGYCVYKRLSVHKRRFTAEERRRLKDEVNIAPHRESFTDFSFKNKSSSDPIASAAASLPGAPEVYIGPPRDEDGHELHNVEII